MSGRGKFKAISMKIRGLLNLLFSDRASHESTTFLISSGRSGSTWLTDILSSPPGSRILFEPFHPSRGIAELGRLRYTYLSPTQKNKSLTRLIENVIRGKIRRPWIEQLNTPGTFTYNRRLIKVVRATLLLPWLSNYFPECRFILLIRHPAAVIRSQLKGNWELSSKRLRSQMSLAETINLKLFDQFGWPTSGFASNLVFWAIENHVAYKHAKKHGCLIVRYEDLCLNTAGELSRMENYLGLEFPSDVLKNIDTPSWSSSNKIAGMSMQEKANGWRQKTSNTDIQLIREVLSATELDELYPDT